MPNYKEIRLPAGARMDFPNKPLEKNNKNNKSSTRKYHNGNYNSRNASKHNTSPNVNTSETCDNSRSFCQNSSQACSTPPVVIFQNKSIVIQNYPFEVNANAGIYEEIKDFRWPNVVKPCPSSSKTNRSSLGNVETVAPINGLGASIEKKVNGEDIEKSCKEDEESAHDRLNLVTKNTKNKSEIHVNPRIYEEIKDFRKLNIVKPQLPSSEASGNSLSNVEKVTPVNGINVSHNGEAFDRFCVENKSAHKSLNLVAENTKNGVATKSDTLGLQKSTGISFPQLASETQTKAKPKMNLKERMYARIKQQAQSKEQNNNYQENIDEPCGCEKCDEFINCPKWSHKYLSFNEPIGPQRITPFLKKSILEKQRPIVKKIAQNMIVHGPLVLKPISSIEETSIDDNIQNYLKSLQDFSIRDIQKYVWPAVQRGLNVFMVSFPKSGKTWAYLPVICSFCNEKNDRYIELAEYEGPLVVILCESEEVCSELAKSTRDLGRHGSAELTVGLLVEGSKVQNNCDIVISTPSILERCVKSGTVKLQRLCHLAIENAHMVLRTHHKSIKNLLQLVNIVQTNRPHNKNIQIVVTSEKWSMDMDALLKKLYTTPIVCFGDFLEAAIYSRVQFKKTKLKTALKAFYLSDKLKKQFMAHKTVVFCNEDMAKLRDHLEVSGVECISLPNSLSHDEIFENADMWACLRCGHYKVLLCSDSSFAKTEKVVNAEWIFHYSPPSDYAKFQKRFKCLSKNLCSPLDPEEDISCNFPQGHSFIVIDEGGNNQLIFDLFENLIQNSAKYLQL